MIAKPKTAMRPASGFSLVELMVVLMILGATLALAIPGFTSLTLTTKLKSYANNIVSSVYTARGEAIKRNAPVRLCASSNGTSCATSGDWEQGWIVIDPNDVVIQTQQAVSSGFKIANSGGLVINFDPSGASIGGTASTLTVCKQSPAVGDQERRVVISTTGKPKVTTTRTGSCP